MKADEPFVSPYLLRPLRSYAQALRDRADAASSSPKDTLPDVDTPHPHQGDRPQDAKIGRRQS